MALIMGKISSKQIARSTTAQESGTSVTVERKVCPLSRTPDHHYHHHFLKLTSTIRLLKAHVMPTQDELYQIPRLIKGE